MNEKQTNPTFEQLGILPLLAEKLSAQDIIRPSEVQVQAIPPALAGKNLIVRAPTGTGKTLAYLLPILTGMDLTGANVQAVVLAPSRELAMQVYRVVTGLAIEGLVCAALPGGASLERQLDSLKKKPSLIVGTPGRVRELIEKRKLKMQAVQWIVVDEGDKMLAGGFADEVRTVVRGCPKDCRLLVVSATLRPEAVSAFSALSSAEPELISIGSRGGLPETVSHVYFLVKEKEKAEFLKKLTAIYRPERAIVFINHNEGVLPLSRRLTELGLPAAGLHSDLPRLRRKNIQEAFRAGKARYLVTTDLLARGMDFPGVDYVFNFDVPNNAEDYLHRVGRTGRAGKTGTAVTLVTEAQKFIMDKFHKALRVPIRLFGMKDGRLFPVETGRRGKP